MTYTVSSGTLNSTIPYRTIRQTAYFRTDFHRLCFIVCPQCYVRS